MEGNACVDDRIAAYPHSGDLPVRKPHNVPDVECTPLPLPDPTAARANTAPRKPLVGVR